jgi:hypothetical protein
MNRQDLADAARAILRPPWESRAELRTLDDQVEAMCRLADDYGAYLVEQANRGGTPAPGPVAVLVRLVPGNGAAPDTATGGAL